MFNISEKVVCISSVPLGDLNKYELRGENPQKDIVYVVEKIISNPFRLSDIGLRLVGTTTFCRGHELGWNIKRFRKLSEIKEENRLKNQISEPASL